MPRLYITPETIDTVATLLIVGLDRVCDGPADRDDMCALLHDALEHVIDSITPDLPPAVGRLCEGLRDALATATDIDAFAPTVMAEMSQPLTIYPR